MLDNRALADELMDDPALDPGVYAAVMDDLATVNLVTMAYRPTLSFLERALGLRTTFRLLDVGYGGGDMLRRIALWAKERGVSAELVGVDLNPRSELAARAKTPPGMPIHYVTGDYATIEAGEFDVIISSLVAHHMSAAELVAFLRFMDRQAAIGWLVNDLHRHIVAWYGFPVLAALMRWHPIVRHDGRLSVARSYRPGEWAPLLEAAGITNARVYRQFPFRLCVEAIR